MVALPKNTQPITPTARREKKKKFEKKKKQRPSTNKQRLRTQRSLASSVCITEFEKNVHFRRMFSALRRKSRHEKNPLSVDSFILCILYYLFCFMYHIVYSIKHRTLHIILCILI